MIGILLGVGAATAGALTVTMLPDPDATSNHPGPALLMIVASGTPAYVALVALGPVLVRPVSPNWTESCPTAAPAG